jgi:hypothetical protein
VVLRVLPWLAAWRIFCEHWLVGSGLWTFSELYPFTGLLKVYENGGLNAVPPHAHSLYLQTASETGLIGLALLLASLIFLFKDSLKDLFKIERNTRDLKFFLLVSASGFLIHNIGEYNWLNSLFAYYFVLLVVGIGHLSRISPVQLYSDLVPLKKRFLFPFLQIVFLLAGFALVNFYKYNEIMLKSIDLGQTLAEYENELNRAKILCERCAGPRYFSGLAKIDRYQITKNKEFINEAQKEFAEALARNHYNSNLHMIQGDIYNLRGEKENARQSFKMAMRDPRYELPALRRIRNLGKNNNDLEP